MEGDIIVRTPSEIWQCRDVTTITGTLEVQNYYRTSVGDSLCEENCNKYDYPRSHDRVRDLDGFESLTRLGGLDIHETTHLADISVLNQIEDWGDAPDIFIDDNPDLHSLRGLESLEHAGEIDVDADLDGLDGLENLRTAIDVDVSTGTPLASLEGLASLESADTLALYGAVEQLDYHGLEALRMVDSLYLALDGPVTTEGLQPTTTSMPFLGVSGDQLVELVPFTHVRRIDTVVLSAPKVTTTKGLSLLDELGALKLYASSGIDDLYLPNVVQGGDLEITGNENLERISDLGTGSWYEVEIADTPALSDISGFTTPSHFSLIRLTNTGLDGFSSLAGKPVVARVFVLEDNPGITSWEGLSLTELKNVYLKKNSVIEDLVGMNFDGEEVHVGIEKNTGIKSLEGLQFAGSFVSLRVNENTNLTDLSALTGLTLETLKITNNPRLAPEYIDEIVATMTVEFVTVCGNGPDGEWCP